MRHCYYILGTMPLLLCVIIILACIPFVAVGEFAIFVSGKFMKCGDRIMSWTEKKVNFP